MLRGREWRDFKFHGADSSTNIVCRFNSIFLCTFFIHLLLLKDISLGIAYSSARVYLQIQINGQVSFFVKWTTLNLDHKQQWRWKRSPFKAHLSIEKEWSAHHRDFCDFITVIFVPLLFYWGWSSDFCKRFHPKVQLVERTHMLTVWRFNPKLDSCWPVRDQAGPRQTEIWHLIPWSLWMYQNWVCTDSEGKSNRNFSV